MFVISEKKSLDSNLIIKKAMVSMNTNNLASSTGQSGEGKSFLIFGTIDDVPYIYVVIAFSHINDIYEPEDIIVSKEDIEKLWWEGIDFLENLGFYLDDSDIVSIKEDFNLFEEKQNDMKITTAVYGDEETNEIIDYLIAY
jgi:hypothetical protein